MKIDLHINNEVEPGESLVTVKDSNGQELTIDHLIIDWRAGESPNVTIRLTSFKAIAINTNLRGKDAIIEMEDEHLRLLAAKYGYGLTPIEGPDVDEELKR